MRECDVNGRVRVGIVGYGYWGPNVVRNFSAVEGAQVIAVCDLNEEARKRAEKAHPNLRVTSCCQDLISSPDIDAVAVVTPVFTHYDLARKALREGKHVFIEKPFADTTAHAQELIELADSHQLKIMVDHTFLFTGAVRKIKQLIDDCVLGNLLYFDSIRVNLGLFQHDVNVVWDLAPHDFSVMDYLIKEKPSAVVATGQAHFNHELEDVAYITFYFPNNLIAHVNVNWLSPVKVRTTLIGGQKKMLVWNDLDPDDKIRVYDRGVEITTREGVYDLLVSYRSGDMWAPKIDPAEALKLEVEHFVDCIVNDRRPLNDGLSGFRVVRMLEATYRSMKKKGEIVYL